MLIWKQKSATTFGQDLDLFKYINNKFCFSKTKEIYIKKINSRFSQDCDQQEKKQANRKLQLKYSKLIQLKSIH